MFLRNLRELRRAEVVHQPDHLRSSNGTRCCVSGIFFRISLWGFQCSVKSAGKGVQNDGLLPGDHLQRRQLIHQLCDCDLGIKQGTN